MPYCVAADIRVLSGVTSDMISDEEISNIIILSDQQIDDDLGVQSSPVPTRIRHLSALLAAIKIYTRPDLRGGFTIGDVTITGQQVEETLNRWTSEVQRIYDFYNEIPLKVA